MRTLLIIIQILAAIDLVIDSLGLGLRYPASEILATLRRPGLLIANLLASAVAVPAVAWIVVNLIRLDPALAAGILVASIGMAPPDALHLIEVGRGRVPISIALVVLFSLLNVILIPAWASLMSPVTLTFDPTAMLRTLLLSMTVPYASGAIVRLWAPGRTATLGERLERFGRLTSLLVVIGTLPVLIPVLASLLGTLAILAGLIITGAAFGLGYLTGGRHPENQRTTALLSSYRAYAPAILIATTNAPGQPRIIAGIAAMIIAGIVIRVPAALYWRRLQGPTPHG